MVVVVALLADAALETSTQTQRSLAQKMWRKSRSRWARRHQAFLQLWEGSKPEGLLQPEHLRAARKIALTQFKAEAKQAVRQAAHHQARAKQHMLARIAVANSQPMQNTLAPSPFPVAVAIIDSSPAPIAATALDAAPSPVAMAAALHHGIHASPLPNASDVDALRSTTRACFGRTTFNAEYGGCNTYAVGHVNSNFCLKDGAENACAECSLCAGDVRVKSAATSRKQIRKSIERISLNDGSKSDILSFIGSNTGAQMTG